MTDFVLEQYLTIASDNIYLSMINCNNYAKFLKQSLELWMFIPCDKKGNVLEVVPYYADGLEKVNEYKKAKERCLFKNSIWNGSYIELGYLMIDEEYCINKTIEYLTKYDLELTPTAIKQLKL